MRTIEFEAQIDNEGNVHIPDRYKSLYGKRVRLVLWLPKDRQDSGRHIDPMRYSGKLDWPVDGLEYQQQVRDDWE